MEKYNPINNLISDLMSFAINFQTISVLVASASVVVSAIYYMLETRHQSRVSQTENVLRLSPWFSMSAKEIQETINLVCSVKYTSTEEYFEILGQSGADVTKAFGQLPGRDRSPRL